MRSIIPFVTLSAAILPVLLIESLGAPLLQYNRETRGLGKNMFTCLPKSGPTYAKSDWKRYCKRIPRSESPPRSPSYHELDIEESLAQNNSPHLQAPPNGYRCFQLDRYSPSSTNQRCPAFCKRRDPKDNFCNKTLVRGGVSASGNYAIAESPNYGCDNYTINYPKNYLCVYNISMSCGSSHVQVHTALSDIHLAENDFVQVIARGQVYPPVFHTTWPATLRSIPSSQFILVFWSDKDNTQDRGFRLFLSCLTASEDTEGSGNQPNVDPAGIVLGQ